MIDNIKQAFDLLQQNTIDVAKQRIGRELSDQERVGILGIRSLMMLEACFISFNSPNYSPSEIEVDLKYLASENR